MRLISYIEKVFNEFKIKNKGQDEEDDGKFMNPLSIKIRGFYIISI